MPASGRRLVVMARWPAPGRCKGRLARSSGSARGAAAVQQRLTEHTLAVAQIGGLQAQAQLLLAADGLGPRALRRWAEGLGLAAARQGRGNLGCRMQRQLRQAFDAGAEQVVLIGSDLPGLEATDITAAFAQLGQWPLVLGPAGDGGYWLLGLSRSGFRRAGSRLMAGIAWGQSSVLSQTLQAAQSCGLPADLLRLQDDLDGLDDLRPWTGTGGFPWRP
jgi:rSAM/selenodomain-associated transferase 1